MTLGQLAELAWKYTRAAGTATRQWPPVANCASRLQNLKSYPTVRVENSAREPELLLQAQAQSVSTGTPSRVRGSTKPTKLCVYVVLTARGHDERVRRLAGPEVRLLLELLHAGVLKFAVTVLRA